MRLLFEFITSTGEQIKVYNTGENLNICSGAISLTLITREEILKFIELLKQTYSDNQGYKGIFNFYKKNE